MFSILYYSATGNTLYLANKLKEKLGLSCGDIMNIYNTDVVSLQHIQHLIVMYSIHAFNAPKEMVDFIKNIPNGLFQKVSLIGVGCNEAWINEGNSLELRKILNKKEYTIAIDRILAMPLAVGIKFSDEINHSLIEKAEEKILLIGNDLINNVEDTKVVPLKSKIVSTLGKGEKYAAKLFGLELHANKDCISCGKCWNQCPAKNITPNKSNVPKFGMKCSMCMKCIYDCPTKAIAPRFSKFVPLKDGYSIKHYL